MHVISRFAASAILFFHVKCYFTDGDESVELNAKIQPLKDYTFEPSKLFEVFVFRIDIKNNAGWQSNDFFGISFKQDFESQSHRQTQFRFVPKWMKSMTGCCQPISVQERFPLLENSRIHISPEKIVHCDLRLVPSYMHSPIKGVLVFDRKLIAHLNTAGYRAADFHLNTNCPKLLLLPKGSPSQQTGPAVNSESGNAILFRARTIKLESSSPSHLENQQVMLEPTFPFIVAPARMLNAINCIFQEMRITDVEFKRGENQRHRVRCNYTSNYAMVIQFEEMQVRLRYESLILNLENDECYLGILVHERKSITNNWVLGASFFKQYRVKLHWEEIVDAIEDSHGISNRNAHNENENVSAHRTSRALTIMATFFGQDAHDNVENIRSFA